MRALLAAVGLILCDLGLHWWARVYRVHIEHRIIDGPPRRFARVTCTRCGESFVSRDFGDCKRAGAEDLRLWRAAQRDARSGGCDG